MTKATMKVEGVKPLLRLLQKLPEQAQRHALRPAIKKAATPVLKLARKLAPVGDDDLSGDENRKHLKKTLAKSGVIWNRRTGAMWIFVGPKAKEAPHGHFVHEGTKPHQIVVPHAILLKNGLVMPAGFVIDHPGQPPNPFLDIALIGAAPKVNSILKREIGKGIEKQALKMKKRAG